MISLLRLAAIPVAVSRIKTNVRRSILFAVLTGVACLVAAAGIGYFLNALWIYLATIYGAVNAGLIIGGGLVLLAAIIFVIAMMSQSRSSLSPPPPMAFDLPSIATNLSSQVSAALQGPNTKLPAVALVVLFGYALGRGLRRK